MTAFISRYLALQPTEARQLQKDYLAEYGTSLSGMMAVHGMDPAEFLDYVHDVDLTLLKAAIFFEDSVRNLEVPKHMGMTTVLVTSDADWSHEPEVVRPAGTTTKADWVDFVTSDLSHWLQTHRP